MYVKLVLKNARRSVKDYLIYIVTMTICVALFYSFLSIASSYYRPDIGSEYDFTLLSDGLKAAICLITLLVLFLIHFVNRYMLQRRQKEFAVQSVMGMEQKNHWQDFLCRNLSHGNTLYCDWNLPWCVLFPIYHCPAADLLWEKL